MSLEENLRTTEEHLRAEDSRQLDSLLATLTEDCVYEDSLLEEPVRGKAAVAEYYQDLWRAFPDFEYTVTNRVADASCVIYEMTLSGRQTSDFRGFPASGRSGVLKAAVVFPMNDGKATGERIYIDGLSFVTQMGLLPERRSILGQALILGFRARLRLGRWIKKLRARN
jgi:steroid delta-isomerase-like uncharacterized protein